MGSVGKPLLPPSVIDPVTEQVLEDVNLERKIVLRMLFRGADTGLIIGKGGGTVKYIKQTSGAVKAHVIQDLERENGSIPEWRVMEVVGSLRQCSIAQQLISSIVSNNRDSERVLQFLIPNSLTGTVIGRQGSRIKSINLQTGATVDLTPDAGIKHGASERVVTISGSITAVRCAYVLIVDIVEQARERFGSSPSHGAQVTATILIPEGRVGVIIGSMGETISGLKDMSGAHIVILSDSKCGTGQPAVITGTSAQVEHAIDLIREKLASVGALQAGPPAWSYGSSEPSNGGSLGSNSEGSEEVTNVSIEIPKDRCGILIGKNGVTVKQIMMESGTRIVVSEEPATNTSTGKRPVLITGTASQVAVAQTLISEKLQRADLHDVFTRNDAVDSYTYTDVVYVPNERCGMLIGKNGVVVKQMMADSGAKILISEEGETIVETNERPVKVAGSREGVQRAIRLIHRRLQEIEQQHARRHAEKARRASGLVKQPASNWNFGAHGWQGRHAVPVRDSWTASSGADMTHSKSPSGSERSSVWSPISDVRSAGSADSAFGSPPADFNVIDPRIWAARPSVLSRRGSDQWAAQPAAVPPAHRAAKAWAAPVPSARQSSEKWGGLVPSAPWTPRAPAQASEPSARRDLRSIWNNDAVPTYRDTPPSSDGHTFGYRAVQATYS